MSAAAASFTPPRSLEGLIEAARRQGPVRLAIAGADDSFCLAAAAQAAELGFARPVLVGPPAGIRRAAEEAGVDIRAFEQVAAEDGPAAVAAAVRLVDDGVADLLMKGSMATKVLMRAVLSREFGLRSRGLLSHLGAFEAPEGGRLVLVTDAGVNIHPRFLRKIEIIRNAVEAAHRLGIAEPKVAILAAVETLDLPAMPATLDAEMLRRLGEAGQFGRCLVAGPISLDMAISGDCSAHKGAVNAVAGAADVLAAPNIETANILYKSITCIARRDVAGAVVGARRPIVVPSRADSPKSKLYGIAFAALLEWKAAAVNATAAPLILVLNAGSTSCRYALFAGPRCLAEEERPAEADVAAIVAAGRQFLADQGRAVAGLAAVVARGGILRPVPGGVYAVNETMIRDCLESRYGRHASNLGAAAARQLADEAGVAALVADPPTVDELWPEARLTGRPELPRRSIFHALNQKAVAADLAARLGRSYAAARLIVVHAGGGLSIGAHRDGRVVDVNNALDGDGPFALNRAGALPALPLVRWAAGRTLDEVTRAICRTGGFAAHLGTDDGREIERRLEAGDVAAGAVFAAFVYQVCKAVAALAVPLEGRVDAIALTGGLARWDRLAQELRRKLQWLAEVHVYPGSHEMAALAAAALAVVCGERAAELY